MSQSSHRGRRAPSDKGPVPLPHTPSPCDAADADENVICSITDISHIQQQQHQQNVCDYLRIEWSLLQAERLLRRYGIETLNEAAQELADIIDEGRHEQIRNPGGFAHALIKEIAADMAARQSTSRSDLLRKFRVYGGGS